MPSRRASSRQSRDRTLRERVHDPYQSKSKLPEPTVCPDCGAVYHAGRWKWAERPETAHETRCPACRRIRDGYPAGRVHLEGMFWRDHEQDLVHLVRNVEAREKGEHPLNRIMTIERGDQDLLVTTTDMHLARAIGQALFDAHEGQLDYDYPEEAALLRVRWTR